MQTHGGAKEKEAARSGTLSDRGREKGAGRQKVFLEKKVCISVKELTRSGHRM